MRRPLQIAAGNDAGRSKVASIARLLNLYVEVQSNPSSQIRASVLSAPGSETLFLINGGIQITGMHQTATKVFFTTRKGLYELRGEKYVKRADMNIVGRTSMADNGTSLIVVDGYSAYEYNMDTGLTSDVNLPNCQSIRFLHGYFLAVEKDTNRQRCSGLYTSTFNDPVLEANCEGSPDNILAVAGANGLAFFLGQASIEPWYLTGDSYPFNPSQNGFVDRGVYGPFSWVEADDTIFFLGDDKIVYKMNGYTPQRISTHAEEYELSKANCDGAWMETYSQEGHDFILLQVPALNKTLVYDTATSVWHDRQTGSGKHFSSFMITKGGVTYVGSAIEASIGILDPERGNDSGVKLKRQMITPVDTYAGRINSVELVLQYFNPPSPAKLSIDMTKAEKMLGGEWPIIAMAYTDDDGRSWSVDDSYELEPNPEMRPIWNKLGYANRRSYRFTLDADISCIWAGAWLT